MARKSKTASSRSGIILRNVDISYRNGTRLTVLNQFSLIVKKGEFHILLGPNGCGKTTILNIAAGILFPDNSSGYVRIAGDPPERILIGYVFQNYGKSLFPWKTTLQNLLSVSKIQGQIPKVGDAEEILRELGIDKFSERFPHELSGGQQQLVAIACALIGTPSILLLDEPLSSLDYKVKQNVMETLISYQERHNATILMVSHNIEDAIVLGDTITVLQGRAQEKRDVFVSPFRKHRRVNVQYDQEFLKLRNRISCSLLGE